MILCFGLPEFWGELFPSMFSMWLIPSGHCHIEQTCSIYMEGDDQYHSGQDIHPPPFPSHKYNYISPIRCGIHFFSKGLMPHHMHSIYFFLVEKLNSYFPLHSASPTPQPMGHPVLALSFNVLLEYFSPKEYFERILFHSVTVFSLNPQKKRDRSIRKYYVSHSFVIIFKTYEWGQPNRHQYSTEP